MQHFVENTALYKVGYRAERKRSGAFAFSTKQGCHVGATKANFIYFFFIPVRTQKQAYQAILKAYSFPRRLCIHRGPERGVLLLIFS